MRKFISVLLSLALCLGMCPPVAMAAEGEISYQEASWNGSEVTYTGKTENCTSVESSTEAVTWNEGWYVVSGTVTISEPITVSGEVNLILGDGCTLNAEKGIVVTTGNSLTIYAQTGGTGTLNATGTTDSSNNASAGIGGSTASVDSGTITIHGGEIKATGGVVNDNFGNPNYGGAGIGGGSPSSGNGGSSGTVTIYGGTVTANSGAGNITGAGIGGGGGAGAGGTSSNITIYGGSVTAASTGTQSGGAGIGGGGGINGGTGSNIQIYGGTINATGSEGGAGIGGGGAGIGGTSGAGTNITISGGTVTAIGGKYAAGIGGGGGYKFEYSGTVTSNVSGGIGSVTISGGIVDAKGGAGNSSGNYAGDPIGNGGNAGDTAATVNKTTGIVFENGAGTVCGDVTLNGSYEVPAGYTLNIPAGASLSGSGTLSGGNAFTTENLTEDMISVPTGLYYTGKDRTEDITTELSSELTKGVTICGQTFTVSGWTLAVEKTDDLHYTATYTNNNDNTNTFTKTITLQKSGTDLSEGKVQTYKGDTLTTSFSADDTITVKATPTATGAAPQGAARLRADPEAGQMAVYVGTTQVSVPADKGADGSYTMEVSASEVLLAAGGPGTGITLTAKFVENDNMARAEGTVKVNISAAAKVEKGGQIIGYVGESGLDAAFNNSDYAGATFTLLDNVEREHQLIIRIDCTLDLGGHTITSTEGSCLEVYGTCTVFIKGEGAVISEQGHALFVGGNVTLEGGTFTSKKENFTGVNFMGHSLLVTGQDVVIQNTGDGYGLGVNTNGTVQLSAGTYSGGKAAISITSGRAFSSMLGKSSSTRYAYYRGSSPIPLSELAGQNTLTGTVTVKACTHAYQYAHTTGTTTHQQTCLACGDEKAVETCSYDAATGQCACGSTLAATLPADLAFTYDGTAKTPAVTVTVDGTTTLTADTGYSVAYENNVNAGDNTAKVTATGKNYTGTTTLNFSIGKATPTITWSSTTQELAYTGQPADIKPVITLVDEEKYTGEIHYSWAGVADSLVPPTDAANYTVKASIPEQDNYTAAESTNTLTLTIEPTPVTLTFANQTVTYGNAPTPATADPASAKIEYSYTAEAGGTPISGWPTNAGTYTVTAKVEASGNYGEASQTATLTINPKEVSKPTIDLSPSTFVYDGTGKEPAVTVKDGTTAIPASEYTVGYSNNVNAGDTATVTITDKDGGNYTVNGTTTFTITKANQAPLTITGAPGSVTYGDTFQLSVSGGSGTGAIAWAASGATVDNAGNVTVTLAGEVTITAFKSGDGNYNGTEGRITLDAGKADLTVEGTGNASGTYGDKLSELAVSGLTAKLGDTVVAGTWKLAGDTVPNVGDSSEYTATFTPDSGADNYNALEAKVTLNIAQATAPTPQIGTLNVQNGHAREYTYDLNRLLPILTSGQSFGGEVTYTLKTVNITEAGYYENGTAAISDTTLTLPIKAVASSTEGQIGTITVTISSKNFADANATINVNRVNQQPVSIEGVTAQNGTYNGSTHSGYTGTPTASPYSGGFKVTYAKADGTALSSPPTEVGDYTVAISLEDNDTYMGSRTLSFTIKKASITITATDKSAVVGSTKPELTYTVSGLAAGESLATTPTLACDADMNTVGSYPITANGATVPDTSNYNAEITYVPGTLTVTAKPPSGSSGSSSTPSQPVTTGPSSGSTTQTTAKPTATTQGGTSTATVSTSMGNEIVKQAVENKSETVVIAPQTGNASKTEVSIPAATVWQIGSQTGASLTVSTSVADVTIPNGGLSSLASAGGTVTVTAEQTGNQVELTVTAGGKAVENVPGGITLTVPAATTTPGTVAMLVHEDGTREVVRKSVVGEKSVTVPLDGSAKLVIVDNSKTFEDVPATSWAADAVSFASAHELFNGTAPGQFSPNVSMSRGMLAVVLHNLESNPEQAITGLFGDVDNSQWYAEGVAWAAEKGIVGGYGNGQFGPNDPITREQLATMLWRYAGEPEPTGTTLNFTDADKVSDYAKAALLWAAERGIVNGKGNGILDPLGTATRAEVAQMLKNYMK